MRITTLLLLFLPLACVHAAEPADGKASNAMSYPQLEQAPEEVYALIEIPEGSFTKYEIDADSGLLFVDRFQSMPVVYPGNYGTLPSTMAADGDPLDVIVYTREPVEPGALIRVRPIGILGMVDGGEQDDKLVAVPADDVDPTYADIRNLEDLPEAERNRLEAFFDVYKQLPEGRKKVELTGLDGREKALDAVKASLADNGDER